MYLFIWVSQTNGQLKCFLVKIYIHNSICKHFTFIAYFTSVPFLRRDVWTNQAAGYMHVHCPGCAISTTALLTGCLYIFHLPAEIQPSSEVNWAVNMVVLTAQDVLGRRGQRVTLTQCPPPSVNINILESLLTKWTALMKAASADKDVSVWPGGLGRNSLDFSMWDVWLWHGMLVKSFLDWLSTEAVAAFGQSLLSVFYRLTNSSLISWKRVGFSTSSGV